MIGMHPAEVVIRTLRVEPVVLTREQRQALPVVRLIDPLGILVGLRAKIGEPAVHERLRRAHHRDGKARCGDGHASTFQRRIGLRAAVTSSRRRSGVLRGASRTAAGSVFTRSAIRSIAAANASSVSLGSVSVGSIIIASGTMSGK